MAVRITHSKVSAVTPIPSPTGIVTPTDWNDDHVVTGLSESEPGLANQIAYYSSDGTQLAGSSTVLVGSGSLLANSSANITVPIPYDYTSGSMVVHGGLSVLQNLQSRGTVFIGDGSSLAGFGGAFPGTAGQVGININCGTSAVGPAAGGYLDFDSNDIQQMTIGLYSGVVNSTETSFNSFTPTWKSNGGGWLFIRSTATDGGVIAVASGTATIVLGSTTIAGKVALTSTGAAGGITTIAPAPGAAFNFNLSSAAGTAGQPLLSGGGGTANQSYGTLLVPAGGTGNTSFTANQVITAGSASTGPLQAVTAGTSGQVLTYVSSTALPAWQANAAAGSTLPYVMASSASGLTGARNLTGQSGVVSITDGGASSNITVGIAASGIGTTQLADVGVTTAKISSNAVSDAKLRQSAGFSIIGNASNAAANVADITGTTDQILRISSAGTALGFGQVNLASSNAVSNQLTVPFGGTGSSGFTPYQVLTGGTVSSAPLQAVTAGTSAGQLLTWVSSSALPTWQVNGAAGSTLPYVMASSGSGLTGARALAGQANVIAITDGGASSNITVSVVASGIGTTQLADLGVTTSKLSSNAVTNAKLRQSAALSVIGNVTNATANAADVAGTTDQVLRVSSAGSSMSFGQINLASSNAVSNQLTVPFGGTGNSSFTPYQLIAAGTGASLPFQALVAGTSGQVLTYVSSTALPTWQANAASGTVTAGSATQMAYYSSAGTSLAGSSVILISSGSLFSNSTANITIPSPYDYTTGGTVLGGGLSVGSGNIQTRYTLFVGDGSTTTGVGPGLAPGQVGININCGTSAAGPATGGYLDFDSNTIQKMTIGTYAAVVNSTVAAGAQDFTATWKANTGAWLFLNSTASGGNVLAISSGTATVTLGSSTLSGKLAMVSSNGGLTTTISPSTFTTAVDFGPWTGYTPTITPTVGALGTFTSTARYKTFGKSCVVQGVIIITSNATSSGRLAAALPFTANQNAAMSGANAGAGTGLNVYVYNAISATTALLFTPTVGGYPGGDGVTLIWGGTFETV